MPANLLRQWSDSHGAAATGRVVKRIERFAGNTTDEATGAAARDLIELIKANTAKEEPAT